MTDNTTITAVDGADALAFVIIRPGQAGGVEIEAAANGMSKPGAAYVLRHVADQFDTATPSGQTADADLRSLLATLAERYEAIVDKAPRHPRWLSIDPLTPGQRAEHDRAIGYRNAARAIRHILRAGQLSADVADTSELEQHEESAS